jgi:hypothetical protein
MKNRNNLIACLLVSMTLACMASATIRFDPAFAQVRGEVL